MNISSFDINLSSSGSIASILGFILTVFILLSLRNIKKHYIFKARVPELIERLESQASNISNYLNDFEDFIEKILEELAEAEITLKSLRKKNKGRLKKTMSELIKTIKTYSTNSKDRDKLFKIYIEMKKIVTETKDLYEDQRWER